ncbi:hypothetical protein LguiA_033937 [Lonicera macranthoides]
MADYPKSFNERWNYDAFLSFRGEDTRNNFTDHLYSALDRAGIYTFRDDERIERGEEINSELIRAIEESKVSIVVFSENYARSAWCLDELAKIHECRILRGQTVIPVFYKVDPSDLRKLRGSIGKVLQIHELDHGVKVGLWRSALGQIANLAGLVICDGDDSESKVIDHIVKAVLSRSNNKYLHVAKHPVGLASRTQEIKSLLGIGSYDVRMVGIYGMGGVGKTTIAKDVYNESFYEFDGSCFIENVREASSQPNGIVRLQEQILSEILKTDNFKVRTIANGICCLKERLRSKKVLIILDDLGDSIQVESLAGQCDWFGPGSRIIMTTRDEQLLIQSKIYRRYNAKELKYIDSLKLFSLHAFGKPNPSMDYLMLSVDIVTYADGLPLALEVLGSHLCDRTVSEWKSAFDKLRRIPHDRIQVILRISFDGLGDADAKDIFLDIACFLIGMDKDYAITILDGCGFFPVIGISDLTKKCLLTIDEKNKLMMHNLIRDMGRGIVHQESPKYPGKRSRLWFKEDMLNVLRKRKGTEAIEGLVPALPMLNEKPISCKTFERMHNLRLLQINYVHLTGSFGCLPEELKWLSWQHCPLKELPSDFLLENLVVLDLRYSSLTYVWQGIKSLKNLKILNLAHCSFLSRTPDFTEVPMLATLYMNGCTSLFEFDRSIALLNNLTYLNLEDCKELKELPGYICELKSLVRLNLNGCSNLENLPENLQNMECLSELSADGTAFQQLPDSLGNLKNLTSLSLAGCNRSVPAESLPSPSPSGSLVRAPVSRFLPASISSLSSLRRLDLSDCNLSDADIPIGLWSLSTLQRLCLAGNNIHSLSSTIGELSKLEILSVDRCRSLHSLPQLPTKLVRLHANGCTSMEKLPNLSDVNKYLHLYLMNCHRLAAIQGLENLSSVRLIAIEGCSDLATTFGDSFFQGYSELAETSDMYLTRRDIPDWFGRQHMGSSISFDIPPFHTGGKFLGMTLWIVYEGRGDGPVMTHSPEAIIMNRTNGIELRHTFPLSYGPHNPGRHSWVCYIPVVYLGYPVRGGEEMEVSFEINQPLEVKQCGVHLVYKPNIEEDDQGQIPGADGDVDIAGIIAANMRPKRSHRKQVASFLRRMLTLKVRGCSLVFQKVGGLKKR